MLGGMANPLGPMVGAAIVTLLPEVLRVVQEWRMTVFGTLLVVDGDLAAGRTAPALAIASRMTALLTSKGSVDVLAVTSH